MHGPAQTVTVSVVASEKFGHHPVYACPARHAVAVPAMVADDVVIGVEGGASAHGNRLLSHTRMGRASDFALFKKLFGPLFKTPDEDHFLQKIQQRIVAQCCGVRGSAFFSFMAHFSSIEFWV